MYFSFSFLCNDYAYLGRYPDLDRNGVGSVTFSNMGPMRGQHVFLMTKFIYFICFFSTINIIVLGNADSFY